jgi:hypothetical protein
MTLSPTRLPLCCSRGQSRLVMAKRDLGRLAQKAALADQRNHNITRLKAAMVEQRKVIKMAEQAIVDHEADHADSGAA